MTRDQNQPNRAGPVVLTVSEEADRNRLLPMLIAGLVLIIVGAVVVMAFV